MIDSFIFELNYESKAGRRCRAVCVSLLGQLFGQEHLRDTLQGYLDVENRIPPDVIVLIVLAGDELATSKLCQSQEVLDVIPGFTRSFEPPRLVAIKMDLNGVWSAVTEESGEFSHPEFIEKIKVNGLRRIFEKRGVLLEGNGRFHYSKPDLDHTDKFLRTANALVSWSETAFLALWLLPFLRTDLDAVYTDTAAINSLVLTAVLLRLRHSPNEKPPIVESFGSYAGLRTHSDLRRERSLFVISA